MNPSGAGKKVPWDRRAVAAAIDHTLLSPETSPGRLKRFCAEAVRHRFRAACLPESFVSAAAGILRPANIRVATVIDFPFGTASTASRVYQAMAAANAGADELDVVIRIPLSVAGSWNEVGDDLRAVVMATPGLFHKVILETGTLDPTGIRRAARVAVEAGAGCVKTCTGYGPRGVRVADVREIRKAVGDRAVIKASGGVRTARVCISLLNAGADIIGTSSGVEILSEL